jgi:Domain of unknown function (DUF397)
MLLPGPIMQAIYWRKSSYSLGNGECIEIASIGDGDVVVRDSKNPGGNVLSCGPVEWRAFLSKIANIEKV